MKKIILCFVLTMISIASFGQKIVEDVIKDNVRTIEISEKTARSFTDRVVWNFGLKVHKNINNDSVQYILIVHLIDGYNKLPISDKGIFLIKTFDDNILELTNVNSFHFIGASGYSYCYSYYSKMVAFSPYTIYHNFAYCMITENQLKILKYGIKKVRLEIDGYYREKEYKRDKCGRFLFKSYEIILQNIHKIKPKSLKENF